MLKRIPKMLVFVTAVLICLFVAGFTTPKQTNAESDVVAGYYMEEDPGYIYEGVGARDWWPEYRDYYIESPETKLSIGTRRISKNDPNDYSPDVSGNAKWGSLVPGTMADAVPKLTMEENLDWTEFVLNENPEDKPTEWYDPPECCRSYSPSAEKPIWTWWRPQRKLGMPDINIVNNAIVAKGEWDYNQKMESSVKYSIVDDTPLIKMDITLTNETGHDFSGRFGYTIKSAQPGERHTYIPGVGWTYSQVDNPVSGGWTDNYVFNGENNRFTGKTAHAIIWPEDQQPMTILNEGVWEGAWFKADIPNGQSKTYTIYHMPHVAGPADKPYAVAEFWANVIKNHEDSTNYGNITGTVTDESGNPLPFTNVKLIDAKGNTYAKTVTNSDGKYIIYAKKGDYTITPVNDEYSVDSKKVEIGDVRRVKADFTVKKYVDLIISVPSNLEPDSPFDVNLTVKNLTGNDLHDVKIDVNAPYFVRFLNQNKLNIPVIKAKSQMDVMVSSVALEGGRSSFKATVSNKDFKMTEESSFNVNGEGYYGGDNHTHSTFSDGSATIDENADVAYNNRLLSWIWATDHNTFKQKQTAEDVTKSYNGHFLDLPGTEITNGNKSIGSKGHALAYGLDYAPRADIDNDSPSGYSWQDSIDEVTGHGGLFYIAHPFNNTFLFEDPYRWRNFTGVEVFNSGNTPQADLNQKAFEFWDKINIRGDKKYFGIANTDAHQKERVGQVYIVGKLPTLSKENVLTLLKTGGYYGTNGPQLRFDIDGVGMGQTLEINHSGNAQVHIEAHDPNSNLTHIRLIKYPVTGNMDDYSKRNIVLDEDLTSLNTDTYIKTITLPVADKEFYRVEVESEKANEGSTGAGPSPGTGFAYSNPIWIGTSESSNATEIRSIMYKNKNKSQVLNDFGNNHLKIYDNKFDLKKLHLTLNDGASVVSKDYNKLTNTKGVLTLTISAEDGTRETYKYFVEIQESKLKNK